MEQGAWHRSLDVPLTRAIGSELGEALFQAILDERLARSEARAIFLRPLHPGDAAAALYFSTRRRLLDPRTLSGDGSTRRRLLDPSPDPVRA